MKGIPLKTWEVRAILEGRKTVTRRAVKPQPPNAHMILGYDDEENSFNFLCGVASDGCCIDFAYTAKAPYRPGGILYVRETWAKIDGDYVFKADDEVPEGWHLTAWHPSIHMPREAARIFLRVKDVWVEMLQNITPEQIDVEGCKEWAYSAKTGGLLPSGPSWFRIAWDKTIKPADCALYGWEANPWCWVIEFERISKEEAYRDTE